MSGVELALAGIEAVVGVGQIYSAISTSLSGSSSPNKSALLSKIKELAENQSILLSDGEEEIVDVEKEKKIMVESPVLLGLRRAVVLNVPAPYVLYAPPSNGKTTAARAFLKFSLRRLFPGEKMPRAVMLSGLVDRPTYFDHIAVSLNAGTTPWFSSLLMALSRSPAELEANKAPSILILDNFDDVGPDNANIKNMRHFCHDLHRLNDRDGRSKELFVFIITQSKTVANALCKINNWKKIRPMPGSYAGLPPEESTADELPDPNWTMMPWSAKELRRLVEKRFSDSELDSISLDFITDGANPADVMATVREMIARKEAAEKGGPGDATLPDFV